MDPSTVAIEAHVNDKRSLPVESTLDKLPEKSNNGTANGSK
jgi:hypothetical protein